MKIKNKIQVAFFIILIAYIVLLTSGGYVSVYITYIFIPTLAILGLLAFGKFNVIHKTSKYIFIFSLILAIATVTSVQYVGVYLIYIVMPVLLISGIITMVIKDDH